ncbi:DNA-binding MarR family transcriptional regulator [Lentzea flaviverrucosa]|jgi:DNA-binding MarR family transcriptional regulator|uniref:DNA-binding transcriptional regulator, MarR family n=2 Tax=Lentzea flaviverrucosa TaxID=200379 RepID=A0A1H9LT20_9PSEU|nr:DNA-binding MarR family transcriptional regulator [Lentzea flaviverrucosa]SER14574.1 DNA-binding transcriptional regulator, MarR family [Lentzea flaviverrucosa]
MFNMEPEVLERFTWYMREQSALTVMFHARVAEQMGLSATDEKCLDLAMRADGPLTAGRIADLSGLSTGAVTGVIDRLERAGYVRRVRDPHDRRKVLVEVTVGDVDKFGEPFEKARDSLVEVLGHFDEDELQVIERYLKLQTETFRKRVIDT